ncbi:MAG TPA: hypothetical protein P5077_03835 [bacterium]|nr:hypothetical protein [bacterium]
MRTVVTLLAFLATCALAAADRPVFYFFHSENCPHCHEAKPFMAELKNKYPGIEFRELEVSRDLVNREILLKKAQQLGISRIGVPLFIIGETYISGFKKGDFEKKITDLLDAYLAGSSTTTAAPAAVPGGLAILQKEAADIDETVGRCFGQGPAAIPDCLKKAKKRLDDLSIVITGQVTAILEKAMSGGAIGPQKAAYLDQQALWKKQVEAESALDEAFCRALKATNCDGLALYLTVQHLQARVQKLLGDLQAAQGFSFGH